METREVEEGRLQEEGRGKGMKNKNRVEQGRG